MTPTEYTFIKYADKYYIRLGQQKDIQASEQELHPTVLSNQNVWIFKGINLPRRYYHNSTPLTECELTPQEVERVKLELL